VLDATDAVWIEVKDGSATLKLGQLAPGETYEVPANAVAPVLTTGKPEALRISVGSQQAPPVGLPGRTVSKVSLKAADLMATKYRPYINGTTMLGQSKNAFQAEIDAACELIDFLRFNVHFLSEIYKQQPVSSPGMHNRMEYRPLEGFVLRLPHLILPQLGVIFQQCSHVW
jgi:acyl-CoA reductase-like NAD-dependent aldehyde dehydrogenase